jgi:hypothetical protein
MITETDEVTEALAAAAARWPGEPTAELLRRLVTEGHAALRAFLAAEQTTIELSSGALTGIYQPGDLLALREEWPA